MGKNYPESQDVIFEFKVIIESTVVLAENLDGEKSEGLKLNVSTNMREGTTEGRR